MKISVESFRINSIFTNPRKVFKFVSSFILACLCSLKMIYKKSQEERQKALLQMQWRVMFDKPQENQEVDSEKENSVSSVRMGACHTEGNSLVDVSFKFEH